MCKVGTVFNKYLFLTFGLELWVSQESFLLGTQSCLKLLEILKQLLYDSVVMAQKNNSMYERYTKTLFSSIWVFMGKKEWQSILLCSEGFGPESHFS